tara:strand:+ start:386 stop:544 length:159 start_codon:yes stop_codon:yes gene_type:complete
MGHNSGKLLLSLEIDRDVKNKLIYLAEIEKISLDVLIENILIEHLQIINESN